MTQAVDGLGSQSPAILPHPVFIKQRTQRRMGRLTLERNQQQQFALQRTQQNDRFAPFEAQLLQNMQGAFTFADSSASTQWNGVKCAASLTACSTRGKVSLPSGQSRRVCPAPAPGPAGYLHSSSRAAGSPHHPAEGCAVSLSRRPI